LLFAITAAGMLLTANFSLAENQVKSISTPKKENAQTDAAASAAEANKWIDAKFLDKTSDDYDTTPPFSFTYGGKLSGELLKTWKVQRDSRKLDNYRTQRITTYSDPATGLEVCCEGIQYSDFPVIEWTLYFKNNGRKNTPVLENIQAIDTSFPVVNHAANFERLNYFDGGYNQSDAFQPHEAILGSIRLNPGYGRGSDRYLPYFNLEYGTGGGVIIALGWPGQWKVDCFDSHNWGRQFRGGQELTHFILYPGEKVRSPLIALLFWQGGDWIDGQNVWRRWMIAHNLPARDGKPLPGQVAGQRYDLENGYTEESQKQYIDQYTSKGLKIDYWWMDAGWYSCGGVWSNVGTWEPDPVRFPNGLRPVTDAARAKGIRSIVWFEPERVTPGTWLWDNHPEWLLSDEVKNNNYPKTASSWLPLDPAKTGPASGRLLNLGNPEARKWLVDYMDGILTSQGIDLYRQDFNNDPLIYWRANDEPDRQGITEIRYIEGYLAYWDELRRRHPNLVIDSCASGGRRLDLETVRRSVSLTRSDDVFHDISNQGHTYGLSMWLPYQGSGTPLNTYGFRSALLWSLNVGPVATDPKLDYEPLKRLIEQWRELSPNLLGDFYPLTAYSLRPNAWIAWQYNRPEAGAGMIQIFRREKSEADTMLFHLRGLDPDASYQLTDIDTLESQALTGRELMNKGWAVKIKDKHSAVIITYTQVK